MMNSLEQRENVDVVVAVTISDHLKKLAAAETDKLPHKRQPIPTIPELAKAAGVSRQAMHNLVTNRNRSVRLDILSVIISELQRRGFSANISDLLTVYPADLLID